MTAAARMMIDGLREALDDPEARAALIPLFASLALAVAPEPEPIPDPIPTDDNAWVTVQQAAEQSGFCDETIRRAIDAGELHATKVRTRWRIACHDLNVWLRPS